MVKRSSITRTSPLALKVVQFFVRDDTWASLSKSKKSHVPIQGIRELLGIIPHRMRTLIRIKTSKNRRYDMVSLRQLRERRHGAERGEMVILPRYTLVLFLKQSNTDYTQEQLSLAEQHLLMAETSLSRTGCKN